MNELWEPYKRRAAVRLTIVTSDNVELLPAGSPQNQGIDYRNRRSGAKMKGAPGGLGPTRRATFVRSKTRKAAP